MGIVRGFANVEPVDNVLAAGVEKFLLSIQARGVRAGQKVLIQGHANVLNDATAATHRSLLRVRRGATVASAQVGADEDGIFDSVTGASIRIANDIWEVENAVADDPLYGLFAQDTHADTVVLSAIVVTQIG